MCAGKPQPSQIQMDCKIPIVFCIDVEPDDFFIDPHDPRSWLGFEKSFEFFSQMRRRLGSATGSPVHFSWFFRMDPQTEKAYGSLDWVYQKYQRCIRDLIANGDECGLHTHAYRWDPALNNWVVDHGNQEWINHCVRSSISAFAGAFDRNCQSFRFGDRWMNNEVMRLIENLGVRYDLTLEPGQSARPAYFLDKPFTGSLPDYRNVPQTPYRPSELDFRTPGHASCRSIWELPISSGETAATDYLTLNLAHESETFCDVMDGLLETLVQPYLALVMRSAILNYEQPSRNLMRTLDCMLAHRCVKSFVFSTPAESLQHLGLD